MKSFFLLLFSAFFLVGCVSSPSPRVKTERPIVSGEIISYASIQKELTPFFPEADPKIIIMDPMYGCISEESTRRILVEGLATFDVTYIENARDCEDLAIEATVVFRTLFRRDTGNVPLGPPIGIIGGALLGDIPEMHFNYPGTPCYHAMVAVRCKGGKWLLVEVQSKQIIELMGPMYEGSFEPFLFIL